MLDYFALGLLIFVALTLFYGIIAIHDIPYEIAKSRQHPQQDAIHVSGWISLFTLHTIWPFLWIWATLYRPDRGWGFVQDEAEKDREIKLMQSVHAQELKLEQINTAYKSEMLLLTTKIEALQANIDAIKSEPGNTC